MSERASQSRLDLDTLVWNGLWAGLICLCAPLQAIRALACDTHSDSFIVGTNKCDVRSHRIEHHQHLPLPMRPSVSGYWGDSHAQLGVISLISG